MACEKRQRVVRQTKGGTKEELFRCVNGSATTYRQPVDDDLCSTCILKQDWNCNCALQKPVNALFEQPMLGGGGEIIYSDGQPPCPDGYEPTDSPLVFKPSWPACAYRETANELNADGSLNVKARCGATSKPIVATDCSTCHRDLERVEIKEYPALPDELVNYAKAIKGWIVAGRPKRTDAEVAQIHAKFCIACDWYDTEQQRCKGCGCKVKASGGALLNKIRMSTQHCPRNLW